MEKFVDLHRNVGDRSQNGTSMRMLYYPCVDATPSPQQQRCGEHTDYGTLTLLYQDNVGGLEVNDYFDLPYRTKFRLTKVPKI